MSHINVEVTILDILRLRKGKGLRDKGRKQINYGCYEAQWKGVTESFPLKFS
jgi:hypothetical protein